jgi:hypothetical protein
MKRSTFITWDQLKVGVVILTALGILTVAVLPPGRRGAPVQPALHARGHPPQRERAPRRGRRADRGAALRHRARDRLPAGGQRHHAQPPRRGRDRRGRAAAGARRLARAAADARAPRRQGPRHHPRHAAVQRAAGGDTLRLSQSLDYDAVLQQASGAVGDLVQLTADLRSITGGVVRGEGTLGRSSPTAPSTTSSPARCSAATSSSRGCRTPTARWAASSTTRSST